MIEAILISLKDSTERRKRLLSEGFPTELIEGYLPACDLRYAAAEECSQYSDLISAQKFYKRRLMNSEIGCAVSHRLCYEKLLSSSAEIGLIFEDDNLLNLDNAFELISRYKVYLRDVAGRDQAFICNLGMPSGISDDLMFRRVYYNDRKFDSGLRYYVDHVHHVWRANAYLISRAAMRRILERERSICLLADDWSARIWNRTLDAIYYPSVALFRQNGELGTTVQNGTRLKLSTEIEAEKTRNYINSIVFRTLKYKSYFLSKLPVFLHENSSN